MRYSTAAEKKGMHMENPTFTERAKEDGVTLRPILMGGVENFDHERKAAMWCYVLFNRATYSTKGPTFLHLNDDGRDDPEWSMNGYFGTSMAQDGFAKNTQYVDGDIVAPTVDAALNDLCRIAADVENYPDFDAWLDNWLGGHFPTSVEEYREQRSIFEEHRVIWRKLRTFLGGKFDQYINNTEWQ